jgi:hypothetical protein
MGSAEELMQRLAVSKKIMDKHNVLKRGEVRNTNIPMVEEFQPTNASYNLPQEFLPENVTPTQTHDPSGILDMDKIKHSKLPDEIKRLMIEQPIVQHSSMTPTISNDIIEGAQRLMNINNGNKTNQKQTISENKPQTQTQNNNGNVNMDDIKTMIRDVVRDTVRDAVREELKEAGMLVESTQNSNETIQFKVGNHLFIGKVNKVKKLS